MPEVYTPGRPADITTDDFEQFRTEKPLSEWIDCTIGGFSQDGGLLIPGLALEVDEIATLLDACRSIHTNNPHVGMYFYIKDGKFVSSVEVDPGAERLVQKFGEFMCDTARDNSIPIIDPCILLDVESEFPGSPDWHVDSAFSKPVEQLTDIAAPTLRSIVNLNVSRTQHAVAVPKENLQDDVKSLSLGEREIPYNVAEFGEVVCFNGIWGLHRAEPVDIEDLRALLSFSGGNHYSNLKC